jgi:hypothetical protein
VLYTWKLLYYFYNRFPLGKNSENKKKDVTEAKEKKEGKTKYNSKVLKLVNYIKANYVINNKTLVFHPNSESSIIAMCKNAGFNVIALDSNKDANDWTFGYDTHWTCYGHEKVAEQVSNNLELYNQ